MTRKVEILGSCPLGLTQQDIQDLLGPRTRDFMVWMRGQTMVLCDGRQYNHETEKYEPTECAEHPHGTIVFVDDMHQYLRGYPPLD